MKFCLCVKTAAALRSFQTRFNVQYRHCRANWGGTNEPKDLWFSSFKLSGGIHARASAYTLTNVELMWWIYPARTWKTATWE